jgi:hypothetical protein
MITPSRSVQVTFFKSEAAGAGVDIVIKLMRLKKLSEIDFGTISDTFRCLKKFDSHFTNRSQLFVDLLTDPRHFFGSFLSET